MLSIISPPNNTVYGSAENKVYRLSIAVIYFIYYELVLTLVDYTKYKQWWKETGIMNSCTKLVWIFNGCADLVIAKFISTVVDIVPHSGFCCCSRIERSRIRFPCSPHMANKSQKHIRYHRKPGGYHLGSKTQFVSKMDENATLAEIILYRQAGADNLQSVISFVPGS